MSETESSRDYADVVLVAPVTVPYTRHSIHTAHWFAAQALSQLVKSSGLTKADIDGLSLASFTLTPDTAIGLTQHLGMSLRWLDHIPLGWRKWHRRASPRLACGAGGRRRGGRLHRRRYQSPGLFSAKSRNFSVFSRDAVLPYGSGGPNASFAFLTSYYMREYGATREDFGKLCVAQRENALTYPQPCSKSSSHFRSIWMRGSSRIPCGCSTVSCLAPAPKPFWSCSAAAPRPWAFPM